MVKTHVRFGASLRKQFYETRRQSSSRYQCPRCEKLAVKRASYGLWACRSCGSKFAGGAYMLTTPGGESARRVLENIRRGILPSGK